MGTRHPQKSDENARLRTGQGQINTYAGGAALLINVGVGYLLLMELGVISVVISSIIAELFVYSIKAYVVKRSAPECYCFPLRTAAGGLSSVLP